MVKGAQAPLMSNKCHKETPEGGSGGIETTTQTPFLNLYPFQRWYRIENIAKVKDKWEKLQGPFGQWCTGEYHHPEVYKATLTTSGTSY